ncbi:MAG TPA: long-chain-acyl-CoA synthetase, partial [Aldersonia sp.]
LPKLLPDVTTMAAGGLGLLLGPDTRQSIGLMFQRLADRHPDRPFLKFEGAKWSYAEANAQANRYAHALAARGIGRGDAVGVLMQNRPETLLLVLGIVKLGATAGLLNHNQRGDVLAHSIGLLETSVLVVGAEDGEAGKSGKSSEALNSLAQRPSGVVDCADLSSDDTTDPEVCAQVTGHDRAYLIFTSGTTGLPKASVMTHYRWLKGMSGFGRLGARLHPGDTLYCCLPLYHNNAVTVALSAVLGGGATFALGAKFSASRFWDEVRAADATAFIYIGELCRYLLNRPESPRDRDNHVNMMIGNGLRAEIWDEFKSRFGVQRVVEFYGASEGNIAFINVLNAEGTAGICPLPHAVVEYDEDSGAPRRGADGRLRRVPRGEVGLLLAKVTARTPFDGYTDDEASERKLVRAAFDDGDVWFDTGDLVRRQGWWHVAFVDRLGDTFRWKGENVATTEVEGAFAGTTEVEHAVVYGVDVPGTDGKAGMAAITLRDGALFDGAAVARVLYAALPAYAVPLFVRVVDELEQTSTFKSKKVDLRKEGFSDGAGQRYVLAGRADGYVEFYDDYVDEVAAGKRPE